MPENPTVVAPEATTATSSITASIDPDYRCPICLEAPTDPLAFVRIPTCNHLFHSECIFTWWNERNGSENRGDYLGFSAQRPLCRGVALDHRCAAECNSAAYDYEIELEPYPLPAEYELEDELQDLETQENITVDYLEDFLPDYEVQNDQSTTKSDSIEDGSGYIDDDHEDNNIYVCCPTCTIDYPKSVWSFHKHEDCVYCGKLILPIFKEDAIVPICGHKMHAICLEHFLARILYFSTEPDEQRRVLKCPKKGDYPLIPSEQRLRPLLTGGVTVEGPNGEPGGRPDRAENEFDAIFEWVYIGPTLGEVDRLRESYMSGNDHPPNRTIITPEEYEQQYGNSGRTKVGILFAS
jgi:Zinc finger, C3HC4 type (RING finger)